MSQPGPGLLSRAAAALWLLLPAAAREGLLRRLLARHVQPLNGREGLRFLLDLDGFLYTLQGQKAVEYGGGLHPKHRHTGYHDFFVSRVGQGETVLDVGCGVGALALDLAERSGAWVVGMDLDRAGIEQARRNRRHPQVEYRVGDALRDLPGDHFDVVVLSNVLEHLPERVGFLTGLVARVAPSRLLIRVPLFERDWRVPLKRELGLQWRADPGHHTEYTLESFAEEMQAARLHVVEQQVRWGEIWAAAVPAGGPGEG